METYHLRCKKHADHIGSEKVNMGNKLVREKSR